MPLYVVEIEERRIYRMPIQAPTAVKAQAKGAQILPRKDGDHIDPKYCKGGNYSVTVLDTEGD